MRSFFTVKTLEKLIKHGFYNHLLIVIQNSSFIISIAPKIIKGVAP